MHWAALPRRRRECPRGLPSPQTAPNPKHTEERPAGCTYSEQQRALRCESPPKGTGPGRARAGQGRAGRTEPQPPAAEPSRRQADFLARLQPQTEVHVLPAGQSPAPTAPHDRL